MPRGLRMERSEEVWVSERHATMALQAVAPIQFNGAREAETKASSLGMAQAWNLDHTDEAARTANHQIIAQV